MCEWNTNSILIINVFVSRRNVTVVYREFAKRLIANWCQMWQCKMSIEDGFFLGEESESS